MGPGLGHCTYDVPDPSMKHNTALHIIITRIGDWWYDKTDHLIQELLHQLQAHASNSYYHKENVDVMR